MWLHKLSIFMISLIFAAVLIPDKPNDLSSSVPLQEDVNYEDHLIWDIESQDRFTLEEKEMLRSGALKILQDESNCDRIIYGDKSSSKKGSYFVTCEGKDNSSTFNVWFSPEELKENKNLKILSLPESDAQELCIEAIKNNVKNPSTLDLSVFGYSSRKNNNGSWTILENFSVKNSFGQSLNYEAMCLISNKGELSLTVEEKK